MTDRSSLTIGLDGGSDGRRTPTRLQCPGRLLVGAVVSASFALPAAAVASDVFVCGELKAAVADAVRNFPAHKGVLKAQANPSLASGRTYLAKQSM